MTTDASGRARPLTLLVLATDLSSNSTGRVHVLWELATYLGWTVRVVAPRGGSMWEPLRDSVFADACEILPVGTESDVRLREHVMTADLIIAAKPLPGSLDRALDLSQKYGKPVLIDVDDPDLESRIGSGRWTHVLAKSIIRPRTFWPALRMKGLVRRAPTIVSNPVLQRLYGGPLVPHARRDTGAGIAHSSSMPRVVFVGTVRRHKGVDTIRKAVAALQSSGVTLTVTDAAPDDAQPWESWIGRTTLVDGQQVVRNGDVVVLPSTRRSIVSEAQLPAKLIDAMIAGRAVIIANLEPLTWATGTAGEVLPDESVEALVAALRHNLDPATRADHGETLRQRALSTFTIEAIAPAFEAACLTAIEDFQRRGLATIS